jgi:hypothetical protein
MAHRAAAVSAERSPITIAAGFVGAFVVASLAVQLVRSMNAAQPVAPSASQAAPSAVQPVVAHQATLWQDLGSR